MPLATLFHDSTDGPSQRPWLTWGAEQTSYDDAARSASQVAAALRAHGIERQQRVAVLSTNRPEFFELLVGSVQVGAVMVALNWRLHVEELARIVADAEPVIIFASPGLSHVAEELCRRVDHVSATVTLGEEYEAWLSAGDEDVPAPELQEKSSDDVILQLYTSGTTGLPKGVMSSRGAAAYCLPKVVESWGFSPDTVALVPMPLFHIGGIGWALVATAAGGRLVLMDDADPYKMLDAIEANGVTDVMVVPVQVQALCDAMDAAPRPLPTLRRITYAAAPMPEPLLRRAIATFGVGMQQLYGQTECFAPITQLAEADHDPDGRPELLASCGRAVPWAEVSTFDLVSGEPTPEGVPGEVGVRSRQNMLGYWRQPDKTADTFVDGWLRTGDVGVFRDGYLYLIDRVTDLIITGGENVYPGEVERVLLDHPEVTDAAVIGLPSERWGESPVALVVLKEGAAVEPADLLAFTRERLATFKCPVDLRFTDHISRNLTGKIERQKVRGIFSQDGATT